MVLGNRDRLKGLVDKAAADQQEFTVHTYIRTYVHAHSWIATYLTDTCKLVPHTVPS